MYTLYNMIISAIYNVEHLVTLEIKFFCGHDILTVSNRKSQIIIHSKYFFMCFLFCFVLFCFLLSAISI